MLACLFSKINNWIVGCYNLTSNCLADIGMKKLVWIICVWMSLLLLGSVVFAQTGNIDVMNLPKLDKYVTDFAWVLDATTVAELNEDAYTYEQLSWHQFVAVLIPDRQGKELFDIALKVFNDNGIGSKKDNDGLLLVIATSEKKIRIMVWYGLEWEMPDVLASKIIEEDIRPLVNSWDFAWAIRNYYRRASQAISSWEWKQPQMKNTDNSELRWFLIVMWFFAGRSLKATKGKWKKRSWRSLVPVIIISLFALGVWVTSISIITALLMYVVGGLGWFFLWTRLWFMPRWPRGWWSGGSWGWRSSGGWSFGWFSWGGWSSWGGGAGD